MASLVFRDSEVSEREKIQNRTAWEGEGRNLPPNKSRIRDAMRWINLYPMGSTVLILSMAIYLLDSVIRPLNNWFLHQDCAKHSDPNEEKTRRISSVIKGLLVLKIRSKYDNKDCCDVTGASSLPYGKTCTCLFCGQHILNRAINALLNPGILIRYNIGLMKELV
ncbi:hypothetical protein pdam_00023512 [Pocillopora damicornis]|uniref:Uncharacterized protein n=1 Tax=Pocillopora damicornis TaxID=46731 RepID=A0A3M6UUM3_POCDA|nr:hypothetical protein pdam_00023512 [Pocillopora damicornis]